MCIPRLWSMTVVLFLCLGLTPPAFGLQPAAPEVQAAMEAAAGAVFACPSGVISDFDSTWGTLDDEACGSDMRVVLHQSDGAWSRIGEIVPMAATCQVSAVPVKVAYELGLCVVSRALGQTLTADFLSLRYEAAYPKASRRWIQCLSSTIGDDGNNSILCRFELLSTGRAIGGSIRVVPTAPRFVKGLVARSYSKLLRQCPALPARSDGKFRYTRRTLRVSGLFASCRALVGRSGIARALENKARARHPRALGAATVVLRDPSAASYLPLSVFRCKARRVGTVTTVVCSNKLGDSFRHVFSVTPIPRPKAQVRGGIPLQPDLPGDQDCSDFSGPVRVLPGDPDRLDADGDGIGCEAS
jgi:hypothetical protein